MKFLIRLSKWRTQILGYFVIIIVGSMVIAVCWQVFTRLVLKNPAVWTEESSTYMLMWCGIIGAAYAWGKKGHVGMEYFALKLNHRHRKILEIVITLVVGYFAYKILLLGGIEFVRNAFKNNQISPTMNIPTGYMYICLPISGFFMLTYCAEFILKDVLTLLKKEELLPGKREEFPLETEKEYE